MNVARAVARAEPVRRGKFGRIPFRFLLVKKCTKNILIIYAPESARAVARARPVGKIGFRYGRRESGRCE